MARGLKVTPISVLIGNWGRKPQNEIPAKFATEIES